MQDERWLHHYMLGKIAEKRQEPASQYLSHYLKVNDSFISQNQVLYLSRNNKRIGVVRQFILFNYSYQILLSLCKIHYKLHIQVKNIV